MATQYNFYIDDSGTRHPDRELRTSGQPDWFALGGVLVSAEDEDHCRELHRALCSKWTFTYPLHSEEIRHAKGNFRWLGKERKTKDAFLADLQAMLTSMPVLGLACVIDRPGYHDRYHALYGSGKWFLCRSAFAICVERASKFARQKGCKLNVFVEKSDRETDGTIRKYFADIKQVGHPFNNENAAKYNPLDQPDLANTLYDLKIKSKSSPMMQIADLYLYPICKGGYDANHYPYQILKAYQKLIDFHVIEPSSGGIKYYCFGGIKNTGAESISPSAPGQPSEEDLAG
jgi:hypothetical protein